MDRLAHFDINIKHIAGKHLALTDYLSKNPTANPEPTKNYDDEYVINCVIPLLEFIKNYGSITGENINTARTKQNEGREQKIDQSQENETNVPNSNRKETNNDSSSLPTSVTVKHVNEREKYTDRKAIMDIRRIEQIESGDPTEENINLDNPLKRNNKRGGLEPVEWELEKLPPPRLHRFEIKRIEIELNQTPNRLLWKRMERDSNEQAESTQRREELHRVIEKIRHTPRNSSEEQPETSDNRRKKSTSPEIPDEIPTSSNDSLDVPAINFKRYLGATGTRYIQMGQASHTQGGKKWDLEETIRQAEQKFTTDLKTIAAGTTNDDKLLKTLVCIGRKSSEQIPKK